MSPAEIEEVILGLKGVAEAAAFSVPDAQTGEAICVAVVAETGVDLTERNVMAHCRHLLSTYKMPRRVIFQTTLPRTLTGKIQRKSLAEMTTSGAETWVR